MEERTPEDVVEEVTQDQPKEVPSKLGIIQALSNAVRGGNLSQHQAQEMRTQFGISQSFFTRKVISKAKRKAKRKVSKLARRVTAKSNTKGQKNNKGIRFSR